MQPGQQRDEKTVVIATAVGLFCVVLALGALGLWVATSLLDVSDSVTTSLFNACVIAAGAVLVGYLIRARRQ